MYPKKVVQKNYRKDHRHYNNKSKSLNEQKMLSEEAGNKSSWFSENKLFRHGKGKQDVRNRLFKRCEHIFGPVKEEDEDEDNPATSVNFIINIHPSYSLKHRSVPR